MNRFALLGLEVSIMLNCCMVKILWGLHEQQTNDKQGWLVKLLQDDIPAPSSKSRHLFASFNTMQGKTFLYTNY